MSELLHRDLPEAVEELRGRVERLEAMFPKTVSASSPVAQENKGGDMPVAGGLARNGEGSDSLRSGPSRSAACGVTDGGPAPATDLRTERVTLEITHYDDIDADSPRGWNWAEMMSEHGLGINESVRVVPEGEAGVLKGEVESWKILALLANEKRDALAARVAAMQTERDDALEQVAELERVALKAEQKAAAEPVMESATAARHLFDTGHRISPFMTLDSASEGCSLNMKFRSLADGQAFHGAMVRFFGNAPAASGEAAAEPVAWGVMPAQSMEVPPGCASPRRVNRKTLTLFPMQHHAEAEAQRTGGTVVPLYRAPQPARGWLTGEELSALKVAVATLRQCGIDCRDLGPDFDGKEYDEIAAALDAIILRNAPPKVVLPPMVIAYDDMDMLQEALAAAGVECK